MTTLRFSARYILFLIVGTLVSAASAFMDFKPFVFYEGTKMVEVNLETRPELKDFARNTVGFAMAEDIETWGNGFQIKRSSIKESYKLCKDEKLISRWSNFFCSGTFIAPNQVLTAAHCVQDMKCEEFHLVREGTKDQLTGVIPLRNLYTCKEIKKVAYKDLAIVETNESFPDASMSLLPSFKAQGPEKIFMLGHPLGMPLHYSEGQILKQNSPGSCYAEITSFEGNSGSSVFSMETGDIIGVFVEGEKDFQYDRKNRCYRIKRCSLDECTGEKILTILPN